MLSRTETTLWRRLERLEDRVNTLEQVLQRLEGRVQRAKERRRHYGV